MDPNGLNGGISEKVKKVSGAPHQEAAVADPLSELKASSPIIVVAAGATAATSWRDVLPIHPAAKRVPAPTEEERRALAADLNRHGQRIPIILVRVAGSGLQLADGITRLDLQEAAGIKVIDADGRLLVPHTIVQAREPRSKVLV